MTGIKYLDFPEVRNLFQFAETFKKKGFTLLRLPDQGEIGETRSTYVADSTDPRGYRLESTYTIKEDTVIARNPEVIGVLPPPLSDLDEPEVYNEWPITPDVVIKNYGQDVYDSLKPYIWASAQKLATVTALRVTRPLLDIFHIDGDTLPIAVSWSPDPMYAKIGDYITTGGYSIARKNMEDYYWVLPPV